MTSKIEYKSIFKFLFLFIIPIFAISNFYNYIFSLSEGFIFIFLLMFFIYFYKNYSNIKYDKITTIFSLLFSIIHVFGTLIYRNIDNLNYDIFFKDFLVNVLSLYGFAILFSYLIKFITSLFDKEEVKTKTSKLKFRYVILIFSLLFLSCVPYLVCFYPGILSGDSCYQAWQALGTYAFSNHHPLVHTLFVKLCFEIGGLFGGINAKIFVYSVSQMMIMSAIFTYLIAFIYNNNASKKLVLFVLLFYMFVPIFGFFSVTMWKDILFGGFVTVLMIQVYKLLNKKDFSKVDTFLLVVFVILSSLFRSNGIYMMMLLTIVLLICLKNKRKFILLTFLIPVVCCYILTGPVYNALNIKGGRFAESLAVPLTQISGVVTMNKNIPQEDYEYLDKLVGIDMIKERYSTVSIDNIKFAETFDNDFLEEDKVAFFKTWFHLLCKYPSEYIQIYMRATSGFWYHDAYGTSVYPVKSIYSEDVIPEFVEYGGFTQKLVNYHNVFYNFPILKYLLRPGFYFVVLLFGIFVVLKKNRKENLYCLLVPLFVWITIMIATPVACEARYAFALFCSFPFVLFVIGDSFKVLKKGSIKNEKSKRKV